MFQSYLFRCIYNVMLICCKHSSGLYGRFFNAGNILVAPFCTFSKTSMSPFLWDVQREQQYSRCDLTILLYDLTKVGIVACLKLRLIKPSIIYATLTLSFTCSLKDNFPSNRMPKSSIFSPLSNAFSWLLQFTNLYV